MTRGILIAGNESPLFSAVAAEAATRVETFTTAIIPGRLAPDGAQIAKEPVEEKIIILPWNPSSPISARTLVFAAENRMKQIHDAILICSPPVIHKNAEALMPEEIEILVNDHIKGWFLLVRELAIYFHRSGKGSLSLVENANTKRQSNGSQANLLEPVAGASFRALAQGLLSSWQNEPYQVMGFSGGGTDAIEKFAAWLFKIVDNGSGKNSGRWHKYSRFKF